MQEKFVLLDPSLFVSTDRLNDAHRIVLALNEYFAKNYGASTKVVIPSDLFIELDSILKGKTPEVFGKILRIWLPFYPKDHIEALVKYFATDDSYRKALSRLFVDFSPMIAQEYVGDVKKIGAESVQREETILELGAIAGKIVFETLAVLHKLKALVVAFGRRIFRMCEKIYVKVSEATSSFKEEIKSRAKIQRALKIAGIALTADVARELVTQLGLSNALFPGTVGTALLLIAND